MKYFFYFRLWFQIFWTEIFLDGQFKKKFLTDSKRIVKKKRFLTNCFGQIFEQFLGKFWQIFGPNRAFSLGADGLSRKAIRDGGLWKFLTVSQIYPLSNQS